MDESSQNGHLIDPVYLLLLCKGPYISFFSFYRQYNFTSPIIEYGNAILGPRYTLDQRVCKDGLSFSV